jgi:hypothetical protein
MLALGKGKIAKHIVHGGNMKVALVAAVVSVGITGLSWLAWPRRTR